MVWSLSWRWQHLTKKSHATPLAQPQVLDGHIAVDPLACRLCIRDHFEFHEDTRVDNPHTGFSYGKSGQIGFSCGKVRA